MIDCLWNSPFLIALTRLKINGRGSDSLRQQERMMMKTDGPSSMGILFLTAFLLLGCGKSREKEIGEKELVRVNDVSISLEEFHQISEGQSLEGKMRLLNEKGIQRFSRKLCDDPGTPLSGGKEKGVSKIIRRSWRR